MIDEEIANVRFGMPGSDFPLFERMLARARARKMDFLIIQEVAEGNRGRRATFAREGAGWVDGGLEPTGTWRHS